MRRTALAVLPQSPSRESMSDTVRGVVRKTIEHRRKQRAYETTKPTAALFWRRVDHPGYDSCRLFKLADGWHLSGVAVFWDARRACHFQYDVIGDAGFRTKSATVVGYFGKKAVQIRIRSEGPGRWRVNGTSNANLAGCLDVDLGFTPATNLLAVRRLALRVGQRAEAPAAYLEFPGLRFIRLPQRYERVGRAEYSYEAPTVGYAGILKVSSLGAVIHYPGLFELITSG